MTQPETPDQPATKPEEIADPVGRLLGMFATFRTFTMHLSPSETADTSPKAQYRP